MGGTGAHRGLNDNLFHRKITTDLIGHKSRYLIRQMPEILGACLLAPELGKLMGDQWMFENLKHNRSLSI